jgi:hypothetical protein
VARWYCRGRDERDLELHGFVIPHLAQSVTSLLQRSGFTLLVLVGLTLAVRGATLGQPLLHMDETFYLLVGERWANGGLWPYVDIWDRKPAGLFLLYGAIRQLGGEGFVQYQLVACASVAFTAWLIFKIATRVSDMKGGWLAAIFYLCWLPLYGGYGGQAPIFFNLFVTAAAAIVLNAVINPPEQSAELKRHFIGGCAAMLLIGIALQIKTSTVFEGLFFGCVMLWLMRRHGIVALAVCAVGWVGIASAPTLVVVATYWGQGEFDAFFFANVTSIFLRDGGFGPATIGRLATLLGIAAPLLIAASLAFRGRMAPPLRILLGWAGVALGAILIFGTYYLHYGLALLPPLSIAAAVGISRTGLSWRWALALMAILVLASTVHVGLKVKQRGSRADVDAILAYLPRGAAGCPYFTGDSGPSLYFVSGACFPSKYVLSGHLFEGHEARSVGVDQRAELSRIIATRPPLITVQEEPGTEEDPAQRAFFAAALDASYLLKSRRKIGKSWLLIYVPRESKIR